MMKTIAQVVIAGEIIPAGTDVTGRDIPSGPWLITSGPWLEADPVEVKPMEVAVKADPVEAEPVEAEPVTKSRNKRG